ncbi:hypothetical protein [Paraburkholderia unamae]|uniref:Uncharacterized protein n=1 Tax=Paraburkholderia unamae TaxID=219649 RepID=A0ACC6RHA2_9BURK
MNELTEAEAAALAEHEANKVPGEVKQQPVAQSIETATAIGISDIPVDMHPVGKYIHACHAMLEHMKQELAKNGINV